MDEKFITKEQIDEILPRYGFTCHSFSSDQSKYSYLHLELGIVVTVYPKTNEFEICYLIDNSVFVLKSPTCSPFYEETPKYEQFKKVFTQFLRVYRKLA